MVAFSTEFFKGKTSFFTLREDLVRAEFSKSLQRPVQDAGAFLHKLVDEARVLFLSIANDHVELNNAESVPNTVAAVREMRHFVCCKNAACRDSCSAGINELAFDRDFVAAGNRLEEPFHVGDSSGLRHDRHVADEVGQFFGEMDLVEARGEIRQRNAAAVILAE